MTATRPDVVALIADLEGSVALARRIPYAGKHRENPWGVHCPLAECFARRQHVGAHTPIPDGVLAGYARLDARRVAQHRAAVQS